MLLDAVGSWNTGPAPQMTLPGLAGEKNSGLLEVADSPDGRLVSRGNRLGRGPAGLSG